MHNTKLRRGFMCSYCWQFLQGAKVIAQLFSPLGKIGDRAIYFTFRNFFFFDLSQIISGSTGPIFMIFLPNEMYLCEILSIRTSFSHSLMDVAMAHQFWAKFVK